MKKIYGLMIFMAFAFVLVACGGGNDTPTATITGANNITVTAGSNFTLTDGVKANDTKDGDITDKIQIAKGGFDINVPATYTVKYSVVGSDEKKVEVTRLVTVNADGNATPKTEVVIMHGNPHEVDPFHPDNKSNDKIKRQELQRKVEQELNVKVIYKAYPDNAGWGPSRVEAIIQANVAKKPLADIYWTTSDWTQSLVKGNAVVDVTPYMEKYGTNITKEAKELGTYNDAFYAFSTDKPLVEDGLFYNMDLLKSKGLEDPAKLYKEGKWNWDTFRTWTASAKAMLTPQQAVLGGVIGVYAQNMVPLNGGALINAKSGRVGFGQTAALETYGFLNQLWTEGLFEQTGAYDSGSALWQAGDVLMHPGKFWFVGAPNRWAGLEFELAYVPYPTSTSYKGAYVSGVSGVAVYNVAAGLSKEKEELAFRVWNALQVWKTEQQFKDDFETVLIQRIDNQDSIDAFLSVYDKTSIDLLNALGISQYDSQIGWMSKINAGLKDGSYRTLMEEIYDTYATALEKYKSGI